MRKPSEYMSDMFVNEYFPAFCETVKAERTKAEYFSALCLYCDFMQKDFCEQTMDDAHRYSTYLSTRIVNGSFAKTTFVTRISCFRKVEEFIRDLYGEEICNKCWAKIQMPALDSSIAEDKIPSPSDIDELLDLSRSEGMMWYVIISLVLKCALTASEIVHLKKENIIREKEDVYVFLPSKKGGNLNFQEKRYLKMPEDMKELFLSYLATLPEESQYYFYNKSGRPLSIKNIDDALKRMYTGKNKKYTIKDIRTRGILEMISGSDNPAAVSEYVGLSQLRMRSFVEAAGLLDNRSVVSDYNNIVIKPYMREGK